jgi:hypothetical protein
MTDRLRPSARPTLVIALLAIAMVAAACAASASTNGPSAAATTTGPSLAPSVAPPGVSSAPGDPAALLDPATPTACLGLGAQDCERARALATTELTGADPKPIYVQVGPFGCTDVERCPTTLAARPEGDVVVEFGGGQGVNVHLKVAPDGDFEATRDQGMGVAVEANSASGLPAGPIPFTLGHCGIFSGIDLDGAWWDPVGPVPMDGGEAVNATEGVITVRDPTHGSFVAPSGFAVQLQRRAGAKLLPMCM